MKRVMITGASGFIGRHVLPALVARGYEVHAASSRKSGSDGLGIKWHGVNLLDSTACSVLMAKVRPSHLLHLAWYTDHGKYWSSPANIAWVQASLGLLRAFTDQGGQRAVFAGTCAEYDWADGICDEDHTPLQPASIYGACKHALSELLAAHSAATGLSSAWGRLFYLFGPGEKSSRLVPHVITHLLRDTPAQCSGGGQERDFLFVEDAADAFAALLDSKISGALNIARGESVGIRELASMIAAKMGKPQLLRFDTSAPPGPATLTASVHRLKSELNWSPRVGLDEGIQRSIAWWVQHERA